MTLSPLLGTDPDDPLCHSCMKGYHYGGKPKPSATFSVQLCCICATRQPCLEIQEYDWPEWMQRKALSKQIEATP